MAHTSYYFEVVAANAAGTTFGTQVSFLTTGAPIIAAQSIRDLTTTTVTLDGTVIPDGHETKWYFQYGPTPTYGVNTAVASAGSGMGGVDVARAVVGLTPNTVYHFRLVAESRDGVVVGSDTPFETPGPSLSSSSNAVIFGSTVTLSGNVPSGAANQVVAIYGEAFTEPSFVELATVLTGIGGSWAYGVQTEDRHELPWKAIWHSGRFAGDRFSSGREPSVTLREPSPGRFVTHVAGGSRFNGRLVRLQRFEHGIWRNVAQRRLNGDSSASFRPSLPTGQSRIRVYLTAFQAGPGYLAALGWIRRYKTPERLKTLQRRSHAAPRRHQGFPGLELARRTQPIDGTLGRLC